MPEHPAGTASAFSASGLCYDLALKISTSLLSVTHPHSNPNLPKALVATGLAAVLVGCGGGGGSERPDAAEFVPPNATANKALASPALDATDQEKLNAEEDDRDAADAEVTRLMACIAIGERAAMNNTSDWYKGHGLDIRESEFLGIGPAFEHQAPAINDLLQSTETTQRGFKIRSGRWRDPQGRDGSYSAADVMKYLKGFDNERAVLSFGPQKTLRIFGASASEKIIIRGYIQEINAALPYDKRILIGRDLTEPSLKVDTVPDGEIHLSLTNGQDDWPDYGKTGMAGWGGDLYWTRHHKYPIYTIQQGFAIVDRSLTIDDPDQIRVGEKHLLGHVFRVTVIHELLHAYGMNAHSDPDDYRESLLTGAWSLRDEARDAYQEARDAYQEARDAYQEARDAYDALDAEDDHDAAYQKVLDTYQKVLDTYQKVLDTYEYLNNLFHPSVYTSIDGEGLLAMEKLSKTKKGHEISSLSVTDLGDWETQGFHLLGYANLSGGEVVQFGAGFRNGLSKPWAYGPEPNTRLSDNPDFSGVTSATWNGALLGFTDAGKTVAGDAQITINFQSENGSANFSSLEYWNANTHPGTVGSGTQWQDGDLGYTIELMTHSHGSDSDGFESTGAAGDDPGVVRGMFVGAKHEGAAGVLEHPDLSAGFGAKR